MLQEEAIGSKLDLKNKGGKDLKDNMAQKDTKQNHLFFPPERNVENTVHRYATKGCKAMGDDSMLCSPRMPQLILLPGVVGGDAAQGGEAAEEAGSCLVQTLKQGKESKH